MLVRDIVLSVEDTEDRNADFADCDAVMCVDI